MLHLTKTGAACHNVVLVTDSTIQSLFLILRVHVVLQQSSGKLYRVYPPFFSICIKALFNQTNIDKCLTNFSKVLIYM